MLDNEYCFDTNSETGKIKIDFFNEKDDDPNKTITDISISIDEDNEKSCKYGRWSQAEHQKFIEALALYGSNWKKVQIYINTRSPTQARSHAQKFFIKIKKKYSKDNSTLDLNMLDSWVNKYMECEIFDKINIDLNNELFTSENLENLKNVIISSLRDENKLKIEINSLNKEVSRSIISESNKKRKRSNEFYFQTKKKDSIYTKSFELMTKDNKINNNKSEIFKIFKMKKFFNNNEDIQSSNNNIINNHVYNQPRNSYINIVTINVCKNDKKDKVDEEYNPYNILNPLYSNILNENIFSKQPMNINKKFNESEKKFVNNIINDDLLLDNKVNNIFNLNFDGNEDIYKNTSYSNDRNEFVEFDFKSFFNTD